ncbi:hypothetical protein P167DRAFT_575964 [Morchella conica CCBAS932]|uniref:RING-type domain-containing protein n=1 Tax=Morchella conica CCBAS932 TaxID=1392247 RepID=A0A3N4KQJ3_9PEZI|nr:hypothetical protein P167DRAFT_575964 [Morchella conica CCBAS932]
MPHRPRPPPGTPHGDITDDLPHRFRSSSSPQQNPFNELLGQFHADTTHTADGLTGPIMIPSGPSTSTPRMNLAPHAPYDGESWTLVAGHGTPAVALQRGEISNLLHANRGGTRMVRSGGAQGWSGPGAMGMQRPYSLPYHPGYNGESSNSTAGGYAAPGRHAYHGIPTRGESSRTGASASCSTRPPPTTAPITIPAPHGESGTLHPEGLMQPPSQHAFATPLPAAGEFGLLLPSTFPPLNESNPRTHIRSLARADNHASPPVSGVITANGDWDGPNNTRSRIRMNGVSITLVPRGEAVDGTTRILAPMPRWRAVLEELDAQDQYVITHRWWRTMRERFARGWEVKGRSGERGWRVEDRVGFVGADGVGREMLLAVTRDPDHRIVALDWHAPTGHEDAVTTAIWRLTFPAYIVTAPPSYHSFGDASDATDIDAANPEPGRGPACTCCTRREAKLLFRCKHRMCRSCVLGMWWGAINRPHHWPTFLRCAFCRGWVGKLEGVGMVEWVLVQSKRARVKLWMETVEDVRPEGMWPLLREMKQRYLKKEGKAAAPPGSETDALGRVIIHDPFAPS